MIKITEKEYYNKVLGSWQGRIAGDFIGAPIEFIAYEEIQKNYGEISYFLKPINLDYVNDDEMYEICGLIALEKSGIDITAKDIAVEWKNLLYDLNFTAEKIALDNLRLGINPPLSGQYNNIYYDAIGAQMRADIWGQICPGAPNIAKYYAEIDSSISHAGIGAEGEIFVAALISNAFFENDIRIVIDKSLECIPPPNKSLYTQMILKAIEFYENHPNEFREGRTKLMEYWDYIRVNTLESSGVRGSKSESLLTRKRKRYLTSTQSAVHVLPNIGIIILSLLYGTNDPKDMLGRTLCISAMMGLDTDCNCGNIGAILGALMGAKSIPNKWNQPLQDTFSTCVKGYEKWKISELAQRIVNIGKKVIKEKAYEYIRIIQ